MSVPKSSTGATDAALFSERDFETLAASIDRVAPAQRELFLTKLVILLAAGMPAGTLQERIERARMNVDSNNEETA